MSVNCCCKVINKVINSDSFINVWQYDSVESIKVLIKGKEWERNGQSH